MYISCINTDRYIYEAMFQFIKIYDISYIMYWLIWQYIFYNLYNFMLKNLKKLHNYNKQIDKTLENCLKNLDKL